MSEVSTQSYPILSSIAIAHDHTDLSCCHTFYYTQNSRYSEQIATSELQSSILLILVLNLCPFGATIDLQTILPLFKLNTISWYPPTYIYRIRSRGKSLQYAPWPVHGSSATTIQSTIFKLQMTSSWFWRIAIFCLHRLPFIFGLSSRLVFLLASTFIYLSNWRAIEYFLHQRNPKVDVLC